MEKKKKTNFKRKKEDRTGTPNIDVKLQKVKEIATTFPVALTEKISALSGDFSPKDTNKNMKKPARPMSADFHRHSPIRQVLTSKSEVNISNHNPANKSPIRLEPLSEETELKPGKKKRKSLSPNPGSRSPNRQSPRVVSKIDSKSPKRPKRQGSPTKIKSASKDERVVPFSEVLKTRFPLLKDDELVKQFQSVTLTNNQKGRIRQTLKGIFEGTTTNMLPDIIYNKIQHMLQSRQTLTDAELRKIRVLYNMLKVSTEIEMKNTGKISLSSSLKKESLKHRSPVSSFEVKPVQTQEVQVSNKRYVVFIGNLPLDVKKDHTYECEIRIFYNNMLQQYEIIQSKVMRVQKNDEAFREKLLDHFDEFRMYIKDIRIPPPKEGKKSAIAYVELVNEPAFEMALSRHHTMFANRRINVLYSKQQKSKMTKGEAKAKAAKMVALVKSGQLIGSLPLKKKRSHRRAIMKQAQKDANDKSLMIKAQ